MEGAKERVRMIFLMFILFRFCLGILYFSLFITINDFQFFVLLLLLLLFLACNWPTSFKQPLCLFYLAFIHSLRHVTIYLEMCINCFLVSESLLTLALSMLCFFSLWRVCVLRNVMSIWK